MRSSTISSKSLMPAKPRRNRRSRQKLTTSSSVAFNFFFHNCRHLPAFVRPPAARNSSENVYPRERTKQPRSGAVCQLLTSQTSTGPEARSFFQLSKSFSRRDRDPESTSVNDTKEYASR